MPFPLNPWGHARYQPTSSWAQTRDALAATRDQGAILARQDAAQADAVRARQEKLQAEAEAAYRDFAFKRQEMADRYGYESAGMAQRDASVMDMAQFQAGQRVQDDYRQFAMDRAKSADIFDRQGALADATYQRQMDLESAREEHDDYRHAQDIVNVTLGELGKQEFTPAGQKILGDLMGELRAIQGSGLRPKQKTEAIQQWLTKMRSSGLQHHTAKQMTPEEIQGKAIQVIDGKKYNVFPRPGGGWEYKPLEKPAAAGKAGAVEIRTAQDIDAIWNKDFAKLYSQVTKDLTSDPDQPPSHEAVMKRIKEIRDAHKEFAGVNEIEPPPYTIEEETESNERATEMMRQRRAGQVAPLSEGTPSEVAPPVPSTPQPEDEVRLPGAGVRDEEYLPAPQKGVTPKDNIRIAKNTILKALIKYGDKDPPPEVAAEYDNAVKVLKPHVQDLDKYIADQLAKRGGIPGQEGTGPKVKKSDAPLRVQAAIENLRRLKADYGNAIPPGKAAIFQESMKILKEYQGIQ